MKIITYLLFKKGDCLKALDFYHEVLGAAVVKKKDADGSLKDEILMRPDGSVLHVHFKIGATHLLAADNPHPIEMGHNITLCFNLPSRKDVDTTFAALNVHQAEVLLPLADREWGGYFGIIRDHFGIQWMFNYYAHDKPVFD